MQGASENAFSTRLRTHVDENTASASTKIAEVRFWRGLGFN